MHPAHFRFASVAVGALLVASAAAAAPGASSPLPAGAFNAGSSGALFHLPNHAMLRLAPGTRVRFEHTLWLKLGAAGQPSTRTVAMKLVSGRVDVTMPERKLAETAVLVRASRDVSAVAMGGHSVILADANSVTTGAMDDKMLVAVGNDWRPLPAGHARSFGPDDPRGSQWRRLTARPSPRVTQPVMIALPHARTASAVTWAAIPRAARYEIALSRDGAVARTLETSKTSAELAGLAPGRYAVRVAAVDRYGLEGPSSAPATLDVIGAALPAGAFVTGRAIELAPGQRVHFEAVRGLRVSYGNASASEPAPSDIGLTRGRVATSVHFREPGSAGTASVLLEPRDWRAAVTIGPKAAHWPTDRVVVRVRVFDQRGQALPSWIKVVPKVSVNVDPVAVRWTKSGNTLSAVVPAAVTPGPWVVRVDVTDQFGLPLGRNFLEVAPSRARAASKRVAQDTWSYAL
jgi:hypothetical protein